MLNSLPLLLRLQKSHTTWHLDILMDIVKHLQKHRSFQESQSNFQDWILNTEISFLQYGSLHLEHLFSHAVAQKSNSYARMVANFLIGIFFLIVSAMICKWFFGWGGVLFMWTLQSVRQRPGCTGRFELSCVISSSPDQTELYPALFCVYQNSYTRLSNTGRVWFDDCNDQTECVTPSGPIMFCILLPYSSYLLFYISIPPFLSFQVLHFLSLLCFLPVWLPALMCCTCV